VINSYGTRSVEKRRERERVVFKKGMNLGRENKRR